MTGGEITGNNAKFGGGVNVWDEFTMTGGKISGNTAIWGGGVSVRDGEATVFTKTGGVISGNTPDNVYYQYKAFSLTNPSVYGLNFGVRTETSDGVIVNSGARSGDQQHFFADEPGKSVIYENRKLIIR